MMFDFNKTEKKFRFLYSRCFTDARERAINLLSVFLGAENLSKDKCNKLQNKLYRKYFYHSYQYETNTAGN
jgi:hypothetical protein